jgi:heme-binding HmuY-like protein
MKRFLQSLIVLIMTTSIILISCKKENDVPVVLQATTVNNLASDTILGLNQQGQPYGSGKYTLFSFETNSVISNADSATTKWDIGFRGTTIITNGGNSGPGGSGAFIYIGTFDNLKEIPSDSTFKIDNAPASYAIPIGSNKGWYVYNPQTNLVTPIPGRVLVIRTAGGKYAKMEILNYYKGGVTPEASASDDDKLKKQRFYTFRYIFQRDGSKKF